MIINNNNFIVHDGEAGVCTLRYASIRNCIHGSLAGFVLIPFIIKHDF